MFGAAGLSGTVGIMITSGTAVTRQENMIHVPKSELASCLQAVVVSRRLTVSDSLALGGTLAREMLNFKPKFSPNSSNVTFEGREGVHDDIVLAVAMAVWFAEQTVANAWHNADGSIASDGDMRDAFGL